VPLPFKKYPSYGILAAVTQISANYSDLKKLNKKITR
jgi:hypothetical protein